jgi:carbon monoxide dehydrogenase subunit G
MILDQKLTIPAPPEEVWDFMMDIPSMGRCVPGAEHVKRVDQDKYEGTINQKVGPIKVRLDGTIALVERNRESWEAVMHAYGIDNRVSSKVDANMTLALRPLGDDQTELSIRTDATLFGKLGEFGQGVAQRKANQVMAEFGKNVARELAPEKAAAEEERAPQEEQVAEERARPVGVAAEVGAQRPEPIELFAANKELILKWGTPTLAGLGALVIVLWALGRGGSRRTSVGAYGSRDAGPRGRPGAELELKAWL